MRMSADSAANEHTRAKTPTHFFLRGLAISLPPILTIVILLWIAGAINQYIIQPINWVVRYSIAHTVEEIESLDDPSLNFDDAENLPPLPYCGTNYVIPSAAKALVRGADASQLRGALMDAAYVPFGKQVVPYRDYFEVARRVGPDAVPRSAISVYMELIAFRHFQGYFVLSASSVAITIIALYLLGRIVTARVGAWVVHKVETTVLSRLPIVSNVYSSVKQVTDFLFSERKIEYNRVVAIEYPRRGIWSLGFVTGESMLEITAAAGEPLVSVLIPTSPMPVTGYTMSVPRSELLDLNITIDQAFQYCISCGVLIPPHQKVTAELLNAEVTRRMGAKAAAPPTQDETELTLADDLALAGGSARPSPGQTAPDEPPT